MSRTHLIGTLFEEEEFNKKQNYNNMKVKDEKGHSKFTGAFEGGLKESSVGYKGTCGSDEGFVPKTFFSSRSQKAQFKQQNVTQFMDEEDRGKQVIGQNLIVKDQFQLLGFNQGENKSKFDQDDLMNTEYNEMLQDVRKSVGYDIYNNMKQKKYKQMIAQQTLERQDNQQLIDEKDEEFLQQLKEDLKNKGSDSNENVDDFYCIKEQNKQNLYNTRIDKLINKDNYYGLGYSSNSNQLIVETVNQYLEEQFRNLIYRSNNSVQQTEQEQDKFKQNNRIYIDFNKPYEEMDEDEDYDISKQAKNNLRKYVSDEEEEQEPQIRKQVRLNFDISKLNQIIVQDAIPYQIQSKHQVINIPQDYDMYSRIKKHQLSGGQNILESIKNKNQVQKQKLDAKKRREILGENQKIDEDFKSRKPKQFVKSEQVDQIDFNQYSQYFKGDKKKQERFKYFCYEKEGKYLIGGILPAGLMSWQDLQNEKVEFERIYQLTHGNKEETEIQSKDKVLQKIDELQKKIDLSRNFRKTEKWYPEKLLCRRFDLPQPYKDREYFNQRVQVQKQKQIQQLKLIQFESEKHPAPKIEQDEQSNSGLPNDFNPSKDNYVENEEFDNNNDGEDKKEEEEFQNMQEQEDKTKQIVKQEEKNENKNIIGTNLIPNQTSEMTQQKQKPNLQLFKSIFADDSDEN